MIIIILVVVIFVILVVIVFVVIIFIAISLVSTFLSGSHVVDSVVLVFACFVRPVIVVIVVTMYVVCLLWFLSRRPEIRFLLRLRPPRITMPCTGGLRAAGEKKEGGVGGNPPLSSSLSPTHNHIPSYSSTPTSGGRRYFRLSNHGVSPIPVGAYSTSPFCGQNPHW